MLFLLGLFKVLYIGALSLAYDFDYVLRAAKLLASESGIRFVIQGEGDLGDSLQVKVGEMGLENVDVVLKVVSRVEVAELLSSADALLLPLRSYDYTGISSKLYEYQASGKPIICCSRGQPARYVSETRSGIVVEPGDFEGLAEAILHLYRSREAAERLGEAGRRFVEENLSLNKIGLRMMRVFKQGIRNTSRLRNEGQQVA
jgi:glycosyltransferase involved in cell wall biosynthesis